MLLDHPHLSRTLRIAVIAFLVSAFLFSLGVSPSKSYADIIEPQRIVAHSGPTDAEIDRTSLTQPHFEGSPWDEAGTQNIKDVRSSLIFEFQNAIVPTALRLQADNNDTYFIESSADQTDWHVIWIAEPRVIMTGLATRTVRISHENNISARYFRIRPTSGDGRFSVSQMVFFVGEVGHELTELKEKPALTPEFGILGLSGTTLQRLNSILVLITLLFLTVCHLPKSSSLVPNWFRVSTFSVLALLGFAAWFRFGQFHYSTTVHYWDFFHYYIGGKYAPELGYDRLYVCTAAADQEDHRPLASLIRDLKTNVVVSLDAQRTRFPECAEVFSPSRWQSFKQDVSYFAGTMPTARWHTTQLDHGFNPSPAWTLLGGAIAQLTSANEFSVRWLSQIDAALLLLMWLVVIRTFGIEIAAVSIVFWGTSFPGHFGWIGGSYLRCDWLAALVSGICALRVGRRKLGTVLISWSAAVRVFPAIVFIGIGLWMVRQAISYGIKKSMADIYDLLISPFITVVVLVIASSIWLGSFHAWPAFLENLNKHASTLYTNSMGAPAVFAQSYQYRAEVTADPLLPDPFERWKNERLKNASHSLPLRFLLGGIAFFLLCKVAGRQPLWKVAVLSLATIPLLIEIANYYFGFLSVLGFLAGSHWIISAALMITLIAFDQIFLIVGECDLAYVGFSYVVIAVCLLLLWMHGGSVSETSCCSDAEHK